MRRFDVVIVGAGAAGLMCAIEAGKRGRTVLLLDHARKAGKKILISGGGRCNFTNYFAEPERFLSENPHFCISALQRYTQYDFIALVERHGIAYHEKKLGQLFCDSSAKEIVAMLLAECRTAGVRLELETKVDAVTKTDAGFELVVNGAEVSCESLVMATGGLSIPRMGATGLAFDIARQFKLELTETSPALVPFIFEEKQLQAFRALSGLSLDASVSCNGMAFRENLLFTHRGLSGPAVLQVSSYWQKGDSIAIDLLPDRNAFDWLRSGREERARATVSGYLSGVFPKRFAAAWCDWQGYSGGMADFSDDRLRAMADRLHGWRLVPTGTEGYRTAEVTRGGISTACLSSKTLAANRVPGLYFIGECVDVTGWLGGYNFQWAWSSGWCAGQYA